MAFDFGYLEPQIRGILSAPGTDLSTISAKRVRRQLLELDGSLSADLLKENKDAVDAVIARVFEQVSNDQGSAGDEYQDEGEGAEEEPEEEDVKPSSSSKKQSATKKTSSKKKNSQELSDAELARRLSSEINGRSTRTASKPPKPSKKATRTKKSSATVDSDGSDEEGSVKRTRKKSSSGSAKGGFAKEFLLSAPLATLLQVDKLSRPQVVKQLWVHIKANELQNPDNKREIMCDDGMRAVFGVDKIDMFRMNKVLGQHLHENDG